MKTTTKTCLLAVMYGARTTTWHANAIPQAIGDKAAIEAFAAALLGRASPEVAGQFTGPHPVP